MKIWQNVEVFVCIFVVGDGYYQQGMYDKKDWLKYYLEEVEIIAYKSVSKIHTALFGFNVFFKKKKNT